MTRHLFCTKLNKEAEGLIARPGREMGKKIFDHISKKRGSSGSSQTMLLNENRLSMIDPKARAFLLQEMEKFLFGAGSAKPSGYVPKDSSSA